MLNVYRKRWAKELLRWAASHPVRPDWLQTESRRGEETQSASEAHERAATHPAELMSCCFLP